MDDWKFGKFRTGGAPFAKDKRGHMFYLDDDGDLVCEADFVPGDVLREFLKRQAEWESGRAEVVA
jgi:hypothetical protein